MIDDAAKSKLRILMQARVKRDELKRQSDAAEKEFREAEADVYEALEESSVQGTVKVDLGEPFGTVSFRQRETIYGKIIPGMEDELLTHFEKRAMVDEISTPKFKKARINEIARECYESGADFPPGLSYHPNRGVTITRQKS